MDIGGTPMIMCVEKRAKKHELLLNKFMRNQL